MAKDEQTTEETPTKKARPPSGATFRRSSA